MSIAIITGASAGIGLATARIFLSNGFRVINLSRRPCPEPQVQSVPVDLSNPELESVIRDSISDVLGESAHTNLHLIHNAARLENDRATSTSDELLRAVMQINVFAPNAINRILLPHMGKESSVIWIGSTLSEKAVPGSFSYVTSKHAQIGMMRSLCQDLVGTGIHTSAVCPGFTDTEMLRAHLPEDVRLSIAEQNSFGRLIKPDEVARAIYWAARSPVLNGSVIHANLGQIER